MQRVSTLLRDSRRRIDWRVLKKERGWDLGTSIEGEKFYFRRNSLPEARRFGKQPRTRIPEREERHFQARAAGTSFVKPPICRWQAERRRLSMTRGVILRRLCKPLLDSTTGNSQKARVNISKEEAGLLAESDLIARPAI